MAKQLTQADLLEDLRADYAEAVAAYDQYRALNGEDAETKRLRSICETCMLAVESAVEATDPYRVGRVVRVYKGRNVPVGTTGTVFWTGTGTFQAGRRTVLTKRLGIKDDAGVTHWTAADNCEVILKTFGLAA